MKMISAAIAATALTLSLSACATQSGPADEHGPWRKVADQTWVANLAIPGGRTVTCVRVQEYGPALSCDWTGAK